MPKVKVNDIQIYYEVKGKGFPLVMIQGLSYSLDGWDPRLVEELSRKYKLVLFDNRGAGRTDVSDREYTMKLFADDTAGLMDALGISKAHVLGLSMGGMIAQELVLNYPEKVAKLVLCSTGSQWCFSQEASRILSAMTELSQKKTFRGYHIHQRFRQRTTRLGGSSVSTSSETPYFRGRLEASVKCSTRIQHAWEIAED